MEFPVVTQPTNYSRSLFNHQLTSIFKMEEMEERKTVNINNLYSIKTHFGIQADPTGYGKTASMVGLLIRDKMDWDLDNKYMLEEVYSANSAFTITKKFTMDRIKTTLIVISQSLVAQWKEELKLSELTFEIVRTAKRANNVNAPEYDVILCTPTMYNKLIVRYQDVAWKRLLYDEPGTTVIPSMKKMHTGFLWFITATPDMLKWKYSNRRNHLIARMSLYYLENLFYKALQIRNPKEYVESSYAMPPINHHTYICHQPISRAVMGFVPIRVETMIAAGNIRGAISYMGGTETDNLMSLVKTRIQEELDEAIRKVEFYTRRARRCDEALVAEWTEKKERIETRIEALEVRFKDALAGTCNICFDTLENPAIVPCCQNLFCSKCIITWMARQCTCPLCRASIPPSSLTYITTEENGETKDEVKEEGRPNTKTQQIIELINGNPDGRFIIFSDEDATFTYINESLMEENIMCKEIKGRSESREKTISKFKSGKINVIFLNSRNNGAGINLQECTDIILFHKMEESIKTQIIGRANRIGRNHELNIHHLIVST
jgi:SNF2 family DNA or RNA helicase